MNISLLTPNFLAPFQARNKNLVANNATNPVAYANLAPLKADTVSFSGIKVKTPLVRPSSIEESLEAAFSADKPRLMRLSTTYLDVLESVTSKLKDMGFTMDREYCELNPIKSPKARVGKIKRSKTFDETDVLRASVFCNNPYDLDNLTTYLAEMEKRGYVLADAETTVKDLMKRGYKPTEKELKNPQTKKLVPDLDIRLDDVSDQIDKLPKDLRYSIGKPQKSGYEDIQMRFVRNFDKKRSPMRHELIILFGPNYAQAKHNESAYVYTFLRKFGEMNFSKFEEGGIGSHSNKANRYIDLIKQMFTGKVSQKEFLNGKNMDYAQIDEQIPISFSKEDIQLLKGYFAGLKDRITSSYNELKVSMTPSEKRALTKELNADRAIIEEIEDGLNETVKIYNKKHSAHHS